MPKQPERESTDINSQNMFTEKGLVEPIEKAVQEDGQLDKHRALQEAAEKGNFDTRGAVGQMFARHHVKGSELWQARKGSVEKVIAEQNAKPNDAKQMYRVKWAKCTYESITEGKSRTKAWGDINREKGVHRHFDEHQAILLAFPRKF